MRSQDRQAEAAKSDNLAEHTGAESGNGSEKHRERFAGWLGDSPAVRIIAFASQALAVVSIIVAGITYITERDERFQEKNYQAWQAINTAQGQGGSGGRIEALEDLNEGNQSLVGLSVENAFLQEIDLENAELDNADFQGATLSGANLRGASLEGAILRDANLGDSASDDTRKANLQGANLENADARGADLSNLNLQGAKLNNADLSGTTVLDGAQLQGANLKGAALDSATLIAADLQGADFQNASMLNADIASADLRGAKHLTQVQIDSTLGNDKTQLPEGLQSPWIDPGPLTEPGPLQPGTYSTGNFSPPMALKVGAGWKTAGYETTSYFELDRQDNDLGMFFSAPLRVYSPENISSAKILPRPKDMVAWLRDHPYLDPVNKPVDVDVGGVAGKQFDVQIPAIPENYPSDECGDSPCLPLFVNDPEGTPVVVFAAGYEYRIIVLNVEGQTVVIVIDFPDKRTLAKSEEVLKTIEWKGVATSTSTAAPDNVGGRSQESEPTEGPNAAD